MAITTYAELQTAINNWSERSYSTAQLQEFIALAEARLNRLLGAVESNASLTGTAGSRTVSISALSIERPIALWVTVSGNDEPIQIQPAGSFPYLDTSGQPEVASIDGTDLVFNRELDQAYALRLRYRQKFALSDAATTNWLLTNHPDLYLAASMMWGAGYREDMPMGATWKAVLDEGVGEVRRQITGTKRGTLRVDAALTNRFPDYSLVRVS